MKGFSRILALCLAALTLLALTACGGNASSQAGSGEAAGADISGTALLDTEDIKVIAQGMGEDDGAPMLKVSIENNLDQTVWVYTRDISVNGYAQDQVYSAIFRDDGASYLFGWEVPANSSADNYGMVFNNTDFEMAGISEIGDIELTVYAGKEEYEEDYVGDTVTLHVADVTQAYDEDGTVALDNDVAKIVVRNELKVDEFFGPMAIVYVYNKSDETFVVSMEDAEVNGAESYGYFTYGVPAGKRSVSQVAFDGVDENSVINELKCRFVAWDPEAYGEGDPVFDSGEVTIAF